MVEYAQAAKRASVPMAALTAQQKNAALETIALALTEHRQRIISANNEDIKRSEQEQLAAPLLKRLIFDERKIEDTVAGIRSLIKLPEPVGRTLLATELDAGLELYKVTCPIGVIGVIFEARPDALVQISSLCLKSGNACLLKGGSEALCTNRVLAEIITQATREAGLPDGWLSLLETRSQIGEMLKLDDYVDLIIPRGSNQFVRYIMENSRIPVLGHADGICHVYVDREAQLPMALDIAVDSKTQYVSVCNAAECLLVDEAVAAEFLPALKRRMDEKDTTLYGCDKTRAIIDVPAANEESYHTEYLDYAMSVKVVSGLDQAIDHINTYGSGHTDCIVTESEERAAKFMQLVDSANVFLNCSTRFSDGFRYGFGAEVGVSTNKIHARGPVGLDGLLIYKYQLVGSGQLVDDYIQKRKSFTHRPMNSQFPL